MISLSTLSYFLCKIIWLLSLRFIWSFLKEPTTNIQCDWNIEDDESDEDYKKPLRAPGNRENVFGEIPGTKLLWLKLLLKKSERLFEIADSTQTDSSTECVCVCLCVCVLYKVRFMPRYWVLTLFNTFSIEFKNMSFLYSIGRLSSRNNMEHKARVLYWWCTQVG